MFLSGILQQIGSLLEFDVDGFMLSGRPVKPGDRPAPEDLVLVAATDRFAACLNQSAAACLEPQIWQTVGEVLKARKSLFETRYLLVYFESVRHRDMVVYLEAKRGFHPLEHDLIRLFCANAGIGLDHLVTL